MKKGFTLIEVIVVIILISVISTTGIFVVNNVSSTKYYKKVNKKLVDAASVYLNIEKDEKENTYEQGLLKGGNGVTIPIKLLLEKGYIDNSIISTLEKNDNFDKETSYLLAAIYSSDSEECSGNLISFKGDWEVSTTEPTYICTYDNNKQIENKPITTYDIVKSIDDKIITKLLIDNYGYNYSEENGYEINIPNKISDFTYMNREFDSYNSEPDRNGISIKGFKINYFKSEYNGLYLSNVQSSYNKLNENIKNHYNNIYFFTGNVENNYFQLGNLVFRIVSFSPEKGIIKLIADFSYTTNGDGSIYEESYKQQYCHILGEAGYEDIESIAFFSLYDIYSLSSIHRGSNILIYDYEWSLETYKNENSISTLNIDRTKKESCSSCDCTIGALTPTELIMAGATTSHRLIDNYNGKRTFSSKLGSVASDSWIMLNEYYLNDNYNSPMLLYGKKENGSNLYMDYSTAGFGEDGYGIKIGTFGHDEPRGSDCYRFRPVVILNNFNFETLTNELDLEFDWTANGTKNNPYKLTSTYN